jgi:hypothetical protein
MKKLIASLAFLSTLAFASAAQAVPEWFGIPDWDYNVICIDGPSNARTSPDFSNNVRAVLVDGSCGNIMYEGPHPMYENGFILLEFYIDELQEIRRYWVYESQIKTFYLSN